MTQEIAFLFQREDGWEQFSNYCNCFSTFQPAFAEDCAVLCCSCIEKAKKLDKFERQLIGLKKEMADILGCGPNDLDNVAEPTTEQTQGDHISATPKRINRPKRSKGATEPARKPRVSVRYCLCNSFLNSTNYNNLVDPLCVICFRSLFIMILEIKSLK